MLKELSAELEKLLLSEPPKSFHAAKICPDLRIEIRGRKVWDFTNLDFIGTSKHPEVKRALQREVEVSGLGARSSRFSTGTSLPLLLFEEECAKFFGCEASITFSSRNQAIFSLVTALGNERDLFISDQYLQLPVFDSAYLVGAQTLTLDLGDLEAVATELNKAKGFRRIFVVAEGVSALSGRCIDLISLAKLCMRHSAELIVDDSFCVGAVGKLGGGSSEILEANSYIGIVDLGFAFSGHGAIVFGPKLITRYLAQRSRVLQTETPIFPYQAASMLKALDVIRLGTKQREMLKLTLSEFNKYILLSGLKSLSSYPSPLVSLPVDSLAGAKKLQDLLFERGVLCDVFASPSFLRQSAVLRFAMSSELPPSAIELAGQSLAEVFPRVTAAP